MARPRNTELKEKMRAAAWESFRARGYEATSYSAIAKPCGVQRNLVQYHFPKKEQLASSFFDELMEQTHVALGIAPSDLDDDFTNLYSFSVCLFQFLLQDGGYGHLLRDVVRDRDLMKRTFPYGEPWLLSHLHRRASASSAKTARGLVSALGSFYALLYHALDNDRAFDVTRELEPVMQACMWADGYTDREIERNTVGMRLDPTRTTVAVHQLNQRLL